MSSKTKKKKQGGHLKMSQPLIYQGKIYSNKKKEARKCKVTSRAQTAMLAKVIKIVVAM